MGRRKVNFQEVLARFSVGTLERIEIVLRPQETRADFLRVAVQREIDRRTEAAKLTPKSDTS